MNVGKQIKYYRNRDGFSQEALAEKIYVSRQSISNWENERSYPDLHNLLILSVLFDVSLDELVKGDVDTMESEVVKSNFLKWSYAMFGVMLAVPISIAPSVYFFGNIGYIIPVLLFVLGLGLGVKVESLKKKHHIRTYRQILDFLDGKKVKEEKPRLRDYVYTVGITLSIMLISMTIVYIGKALLQV